MDCIKKHLLEHDLSWQAFKRCEKAHLGEQMPVKRKRRRRYARCAARKIEKRSECCDKSQCGPVHGLGYTHHT